MDRKRVGILVFPEVEVLDFCGPFEVFSVTRLDEEARREEPSPFEVLLVAESTDTVVATGGLKVIPDLTLDDLPAARHPRRARRLGHARRDQEPALLDWIGERGRAGRDADLGLHGLHAARQAGLLDGRRATTHWRSLAGCGSRSRL